MKNLHKRLCAAVIAALLAFSFSACEEDAPHPENEIIEYTLTSEPLTLDPQIAEDAASVMLVKNLFEGLVREGADGQPAEGMAKSWEVSDDGITYTFSLFDDTKWSDGSPVTADDFVFGITRALDPQTRSENAYDLYLIKNAQSFSLGKASADDLGVKALDDKTLQITLEYPSDNLLNVLALPAAMPCREEFFAGSKGKYGKEPELLITNGPFCIRENYGWDHGKYIYIRRSDEYKAANTAVPLGVNFNIGSAPSDPVAEITSGESDLCEIYGTQLSRAEESGLTVETTSSTLWGVCFNTEIKAFKNAKLRVALLGSLDRDTLLDGVPESYVKTSQLIADTVSFGGRNYRRAAGKILLDKAQDPSQMYSKAKAELDELDIEMKSSYNILCLDDETSSKIVTLMITRWNAVTGCYFNKEPLARSELEQRIKDGDYEIAIAPLNTAVDSPMEFLSAFKSDSPNNAINLIYPKYDEFIDTAQSATDVDEMISSLKSAEKYLIEYGYLYPLYYESRYFATSPNLGGIIYGTPSGCIDFTKAEKTRTD